MSKRRMGSLATGLGLVAGITMIVWAGEHEVKISLDQVPATARAALLKLAGDARITEVEREERHGVVLYEAEWTADGRETEAKVTTHGDLVKLEQEVDARDVPASVKAAAARAFPEGTRVEYEKTTLILYEIEARIDGKKKEILVSPTGRIVRHEEHQGLKHEEHEEREGSEEHEEHVSIDQVPEAVKATILAESRGAPIKEIECEKWKGRTIYEAEWIVNGQEVEIKVAPDGTLLKKEIEKKGHE